VLRILHVPGHTHSSVALYDAATHLLFAGDFIYPTTLYAFLPGASLAEYRTTTRKLLATLPADTKIWTAHCCRVGERTSAPWLTTADLRDLNTALAAIQSGESHSTGFFPRRLHQYATEPVASGVEVEAQHRQEAQQAMRKNTRRGRSTKATLGDTPITSRQWRRV
jgi:glyoxylase-like metal-dependent hydrolase (beta-lactamase superfamily II)